MASVLGVHLLGGGDLGIPLDPKQQSQVYKDFWNADHQARLHMLGRVTDGEHHQGTPLATFLHTATGIDQLLLVATRQHPPDERDTWQMATFLTDMDRATFTALYGAAPAREILEINDFTLHAFRTALRDWLIRNQCGQLTLAVGPGSKHAFVGLLLGALEGGSHPSLCNLHGSGGMFDLLVTHDPQLWYARLSLFKALSIIDPERGEDWRLLDAIIKLNWNDVTSRTPSSSPGVVDRLSIPRSTLSGTAPSTPADWGWYRRLLQSILCRRIGRSEVDGLFLVGPWIEAHVGEHLAGSYTGPPPLGELAAAYYRQQNTPGLSSDVRSFLKSASKLRDSATSVRHCQPKWRLTMPERAPQQVRTTVTPVTGADPLADALQAMHVADWTLVPTDDIVFLHCVGNQNLPSPNSSPMLTGLADGLTDQGLPLNRSHLRLVSTEATHQDAHTIADLAANMGFASASVLGPVEVADYEDVQRCVTDGLRSEADAHKAIVVLVGPGTKAMNLGAVSGAVQAGFDAVRPVSVGGLVEVGRGPTSQTRLSWRNREEDRVAARLAHDNVVNQVLPMLVDELELGTARLVLETASPHWAGLRAQVEVLDILTFGTDDELRSKKNARTLASELAIEKSWLNTNGEKRLWPSRVLLLRRLVTSNPWRAVAMAACLAERAFGPSQWQSCGPNCQQLWQYRNKSPLVHQIWAHPPPASHLNTVLTRAVKELSSSRLIPEKRPSDDALKACFHRVNKAVMKAFRTRS